MTEITDDEAKAALKHLLGGEATQAEFERIATMSPEEYRSWLDQATGER
jgi:hypothetical protein